MLGICRRHTMFLWPAGIWPCLSLARDAVLRGFCADKDVPWVWWSSPFYLGCQAARCLQVPRHNFWLQDLVVGCLLPLFVCFLGIWLLRMSWCSSHWWI